MAHADFDPYALLDALRAGGDVDKIRSSVEFVLQALIEVEATEAIGAASPTSRRPTVEEADVTTSGGGVTAYWYRREDAQAQRILRHCDHDVLERSPATARSRYIRDHEALIVIDDGSVYAGSLPRRALRLVRTRHDLHHQELSEA